MRLLPGMGPGIAGDAFMTAMWTPRVGRMRLVTAGGFRDAGDHAICATSACSGVLAWESKVMHITAVRIGVPDPAATARFFRDVLDCPVKTSGGTPQVRIGNSTLTIGEHDGPAGGYYHLAFDIPEDQVVAARDLLRARTAILPGGDDGILTGSEAWNSHSVYFNAPGNLNLELIARHRRPNATAGPFSFAQILRISEVGIPVDDTFGAVSDLQATFGIEPFDQPSETFAPMGSDDGLIILVRTGRIWLPTGDQAALPLPLHVEARGIDGSLRLHPDCTITGTA